MAHSVVVVFTDLVDSTAIASRVGPERAEELRIEHFGLLRGALRPHRGREVKNLGDGMMMVFPSASAALSAGVAMQRAFEARNAEIAADTEQLHIRVGISAGEADEDGGDFFGPPVVEAARLCGICDGDQILTTAVVKVLVGARGGFDLERVGPRPLKGLIEPVEVCALDWTRSSEATGPSLEAGAGAGSDLLLGLPARLTASAGGIFAGRVAETARWDSAWKEVTAGDPRLWLVDGEAGIGKTTLVSHLAERAHADGAIVLYGRCVEDLGVPYQPWIEALSPLVEHAPLDLIADHVGARGGALARLVPALAERAYTTVPVASDPVAERYAVFGAITDLLQRAAARRPIVLVVDDLHWADKPTVQLLRHLAALEEHVRLMVVATYRPTDISAGHPLAEAFALLHRLGGVEFVELGGLDDAELLDLMEATAGHQLGADGLALRDAIRAETDGNAFFALEILRHLVETGAIVNHEGRWIAPTDLTDQGLPVSIRHVVGERVLRLGPEAKQLLMVAAVIGRDFDLDLLVEVADADEADVLDTLDAAVEASLLSDVGLDQYSFAHALIAHALCEELSPSRLGRVHRRIALAIEARCGTDPGERIGELAHHWSSAVVPEDLSKAIDYARRAGDRALVQLAPDEALRWYTQSLELADRHQGLDDTRVALLVGLGTAQRQIGDPTHRETLLEAAAAARASGDTDGLVAVAFANHRGFASVTGGRDDERLEVVEAALAIVGGDDGPERARLLAIRAAELTYDDDASRRIGSAREAVEIARRIDDPQTLLAALLGLTTSLHRVRTAPCEEAVALAQALDDNVSLVSAAATFVTESLGVGDRAGFDRAIDTCVAAAARIGQPTLVWRSMIGQVMAAIVEGDLDGADELAERHLALGIDSSQPDAMILYSALIATIRFHQGRLSELAELMEAALLEIPDVAMIRAGLGISYLERGEGGRARAAFEREAAAGFVANDDVLHLTYLCLLAHLCARLGDRDRAGALLVLLEPQADQIETTAATAFFSTPACAGMLAALLDRHDEADRHFTRALELTTGFGFPYLEAAAQLEWGRALLARSPADPDRAGPLLDDALSAAGRHGFGGIEREIRALRGEAS